MCLVCGGRSTLKVTHDLTAFSLLLIHSQLFARRGRASKAAAPTRLAVLRQHERQCATALRQLLSDPSAAPRVQLHTEQVGMSLIDALIFVCCPVLFPVVLCHSMRSSVLPRWRGSCYLTQLCSTEDAAAPGAGGHEPDQCPYFCVLYYFLYCSSFVSCCVAPA